MSRDRRRAFISVEDVKVDHTSHWDLDQMPYARIDAMHRRVRRKRRLRWLIAILSAGVLAGVLATSLARSANGG